MAYRMFIDDERFPPEDGPNDWIICRDLNKVKWVIKMMGSAPYYISFDHDLGDGVPTGLDIAKWLVEKDMDSGGTFLPREVVYYVHSQNPVGKENIEAYINSYLGQKG